MIVKVMRILVKCIKWYIKSIGEAYKNEGYRYYRLY